MQMGVKWQSNQEPGERTSFLGSGRYCANSGGSLEGSRLGDGETVEVLSPAGPSKLVGAPSEGVCEKGTGG